MGKLGEGQWGCDWGQIYSYVMHLVAWVHSVCQYLVNVSQAEWIDHRFRFDRSSHIWAKISHVKGPSF